MHSEAQQQTAEVFGFKWEQQDSYGSPAYIETHREYYLRHYGDIENAPWWAEYGDRPKVLDVGCGAGFCASQLFASRLAKIDYLGIDISGAQDVAREKFAAQGLPGQFEYGDMVNLKYPAESFDVILAEGVLHHTDSTENAFKAVAKHLKTGGRFMGYIYRKKGPIREFTDDYIRERLSKMPPAAAWEALKPLTELGKTLGALDIEIDIPQAIDVLDIPAGKINLQRLFYWHIFKAYYRPEWSDEEMLHVNYDWFAPKNCFRHTQEELERWCKECGLEIERLDTDELAGYTFIAKKVSPDRAKALWWIGDAPKE